MTHIYTSDEILNADDLYDIQEMDSFKYRLTDGEIEWLDFVNGRYDIADYIYNHLEDGVLTIDGYHLSEALDRDCGSYGKAVCLSDDTALQKICFWCYFETNGITA